jgi:hypothetical protein
MNTELYLMMQRAECRYLTESELARVRDYAVNMTTRLDVARRVEESEEAIVAHAADAFFARYPEAARSSPDSHARVARELSSTVRHATSAYVRDDPSHFARSYAQWVSGLVRASGGASDAVAAHQCLKASLHETLDAFEARSICKFVDLYLEELSS